MEHHLHTVVRVGAVLGWIRIEVDHVYFRTGQSKHSSAMHFDKLYLAARSEVCSEVCGEVHGEVRSEVRSEVCSERCAARCAVRCAARRAVSCAARHLEELLGLPIWILEQSDRDLLDAIAWLESDLAPCSH